VLADVPFEYQKTIYSEGRGSIGQLTINGEGSRLRLELDVREYNDRQQD
jgi:hypothetical protein